jgi:hypothetical protein
MITDNLRIRETVGNAGDCGQMENSLFQPPALNLVGKGKFGVARFSNSFKQKQKKYMFLFRISQILNLAHLTCIR